MSPFQSRIFMGMKVLLHLQANSLISSLTRSECMLNSLTFYCLSDASEWS
jgi:hypothetical protein